MKSFKTAKGTELPLLDMRGKDYLEVKYRLVWFREERPTWGIETELLAHDTKGCLARAIIRDDQGRIVATSHKTETAQGFPDFIEKSETGAIGRALALIGYGTQFADELDEGERIVDSPVQRPQSKPAASTPAPAEPNDPGAYVITFGKHRGKRLDQVGPHDLNSWVNFMREQPELSPKANEAVTAAETFLLTRDLGRAK